MDADDQHQETIHMGTLIDPIKAHCFKTCLSCSNRLQVLVASLGLGRLIGELAIEKCEALRLPAPLSPSSSCGVCCSNAEPLQNAPKWKNATAKTGSTKSRRSTTPKQQKIQARWANRIVVSGVITLHPLPVVSHEAVAEVSRIGNL